VKETQGKHAQGSSSITHDAACLGFQRVLNPHDFRLTSADATAPRFDERHCQGPVKIVEAGDREHLGHTEEQGHASLLFSRAESKGSRQNEETKDRTLSSEKS
jgi:hypothetical protein